MVHFFSGRFIATPHDQTPQMVVKSKGNGTPYLEGTSSLVKIQFGQTFFWYPTKMEGETWGSLFLGSGI